MPPLQRGLYEQILTDLLARQLEDAHGEPYRSDLRAAEAADRIAWHLARVVERAIEAYPEADRAKEGAQLARQLIDQIGASANARALLSERLVEPPQVLRSIRALRPDGRSEQIVEPLIPLLDTTLLTNAPGEPNVGHQIRTEIASADRIDMVMAFIRRSGMLPLRDALRRHTESGRPLRVITTTYTGSTEAEALELLSELGAEVRVSYDTSTNRLHAKAWLFHRDSGFATAYVGSSNLTHSAQVSGLEWNVRVSGARNRPVIEKIAAVFESYWQQPDFEEFDRERFHAATKVSRDPSTQLILSPVEINPYPFQERLLEEIELSRQRGYHRNLLVAATGTGKTVMAAVYYSRLRKLLPRARLLFVAHRAEILEQSRATFAHALRDAGFGELWVRGNVPQDFEHVFASIQSLGASGLETLAPDHFDVVIVDEFHHAAASSYDRLLAHVQPHELLGLTATPERSDGLPILHWFGDRIAAELRLWDAIDQQRLTPFAYYGIADELDLREIPWKRGTGYDVEALTSVITGTDIWARRVLSEFGKYVGRTDEVRALGFCVSVDHARYMARVFNSHNVRAVAVSAETSQDERRRALTDLAAARVNVVFAVDLFNEGVDVPSVDTLLMLRPTESPLLFLQQLGRGLRRYDGKSLCTVLDFVGQHRKEFRYDRRFRALLGGSRDSVKQQIEAGFPFLPAGCHMELDRVASERVLESIKRSVPSNWTEKAAELRQLGQDQPDISLGTFLEESGLELEDVYAGNRSWSDLREAAGLTVNRDGPSESELRRACGRLMHVDDMERLEHWRRWLQQPSPATSAMMEREQRIARMLLAQLLDQVAERDATLASGAKLLWSHPQVRAELVELFSVLADQISHIGKPLDRLPDVPLQVHARYTRHEILAACGVTEGVKSPTWREGVRFAPEVPADFFAFTFDKTSGQFSPTTRYRDYAINADLIHWESQSTTSSNSRTGQRYQNHERQGSNILLFARLRTDDRAFYFLGPATYVSHTGERPMAITWRLKYSLPGDLFATFAAAVA
jgi:superfamily II DNA or RNA helicase